MSKKMCELCGKNPATVPDRERMGRPVNRICSECHRKRLASDMKIVLTRMLDLGEAGGDVTECAGYEEDGTCSA